MIVDLITDLSIKFLNATGQPTDNWLPRSILLSVVEYRKAEYRGHKFEDSFCYFGLDTAEKTSPSRPTKYF